MKKSARSLKKSENKIKFENDQISLGGGHKKEDGTYHEEGQGLSVEIPEILTSHGTRGD